MSLKQINENLWVQELQLDIFDVRGALIVGNERAVVWDTLSHPRDMKPYLPLIDDKELWVVYSHADWDHIWGTAGFPLPPTVIMSHALCLARFATDVPKKLAEMQQGEPGLWNDVQLQPPTITFQESVSINLGGLTIELSFLPGHTEDCIVAFLPESGVALMGDTIETPFPVVEQASPIPEWIHRLQGWAQNKRVTTVIPSHGPIGGRELITQTIDYLEKLQAGEEIDVPDHLTDFYRETHQSNLGWTR